MGSVSFARASFWDRLYIYTSVFAGSVDFESASFLGRSLFNSSRFDGSVCFKQASFKERASFSNSKLTGANFDEAKFTRAVAFREVEIAEYSRFERVVFSEDARFSYAKFLSPHCTFDESVFAQIAHFSHCEFSLATFNEATFVGDCHFLAADFETGGRFGGTVFNGRVRFNRATFASAWFKNAVSTKDAQFFESTFDGPTVFTDSRWRHLNLSGSKWNTPLVRTTGIAAIGVTLAEAVFAEPVDLFVQAKQLNMSRFRAQERLHLRIKNAQVHLAGADLASASLIESTQTKESTRSLSGWFAIPDLGIRGDPTPRLDGVALHVWLGSVGELMRLSSDLTEALDEEVTASLCTVDRSHVSGVTVSGLDLRTCRFDSADGLDALVLAGNVGLLNTHHELGFSRRWWTTRRRVIAEEQSFRRELQTSTARTKTSRSDEGRRIAAAYRSLRKALEDSKDEPGAADFYYGEMEMRRLTASPLKAEWWLLTLYWLVSGYGLRASRAFVALIVTIVVGGWCFSNSDFRRVSDTSTAVPMLDPASSAWPWAFAAQEAVSIFRFAGTTGVTLVGLGVVVDIVVRIMGPVLIALMVLAIRNRTKR